jgi:hypothetical protein
MHRVMKARTAQEAREQIGRGQAPSVEWAAIPNMNDSGELDTAFLLTWSEVIPPERGSARVSASERRAVERRNFMCGFSPSRSVDDLSVVKRIMVQRTRREGVAEGPPREIARGEEGQPAPLLRLEARPKVRERLVGEQEQVALPAQLKAPPEQEILAASFDLAQKQGVVVMAQAGELVAQVIDAEGKPVGPLSKAGPVRAVEPQATFFQDGWYIPVEKGKSLRVLTGPRAGTEIKATIGEPALQGWSLVGARIAVIKDTTRVLTAVEDNPGGIDVHSNSLLGVMKKDAKAIGYAPLLAPGGPGKAAQVLDNGVIALFDYEVADPLESPTISRSQAWRTLVPSPRDTQPTSWHTQGESAIVDMYGDHVLVMRTKITSRFLVCW